MKPVQLFGVKKNPLTDCNIQMQMTILKLKQHLKYLKWDSTAK